MTTSFTTFVASTIWGSKADKEKEAGKVERQELAQKLIAKGVDETDAHKAAKLCPTVLHLGKEYLLLDYMIDFGAKESEAVQALIATNGKVNETIQYHEDTFLKPRRQRKAKRHKMIQQLVEMGIVDGQEANKILKSVGWDLEEARALMVQKLERQTKELTRLTAAKQEALRKVKKTTKATAVRRAASGKIKKQSRYANAVHVGKSKKQQTFSETIVDWSDSEDEKELDSLLNTISMEDEEKEKATGYHSSDESDVDMAQEEEEEEEVHTKPAAIRNNKEPAKTIKPVAIHNKEPAKKKASPVKPVSATATLKNATLPIKNPPKSTKMKIFNLRKRIAAPVANSLTQALMSVQSNNNNTDDCAVAEFQSLKNKQEFRVGPPAEYLDLLIEFPSLRLAVIKALEGKAQD